MTYRRRVKNLVFTTLLAAACVSAPARERTFDKTLQVTSVDAETGSRVDDGSGGTYAWHKMVGQVDRRGYSFKSSCRWVWSRCNWLLPGKFPARWINRSTLEIEYHDSKGALKTEKIYVLDVYDLTPSEKAPQVAPTSAPPDSRAGLASRIFVSSTPDGADIEIDRSFVGSTPSTVEVCRRTLGNH